MEFSRQEYWSALPFSNPGDFPKRESPMSPALAGRFFFLTTAPSGKPVLKSFVFKNGREEVQPRVHFTCNMMLGYWLTLSQMNTFEKFSNFKRTALSPPCPNLSIHPSFLSFSSLLLHLPLQRGTRMHTDGWEGTQLWYNKSLTTPRTSEWAHCWPNWWVCVISTSFHPVLIVLLKFLLSTWPYVTLRQFLQLRNWWG